MIINLNELNIKDEINFNINVEKNDDLDKRIYDLKNANAFGKIYTNTSGEVLLECNFVGTMFITDSISLEIIPYDFEINIEENLEDLKENYQDCYSFSKNTLDLIKVLWQNIVLEVPLRFTKVTDYSKLCGDGWRVLSEDDKKESNNPFKELESMFGKE